MLKNSLFLPGLWPGFCGDLSSRRPHAEHLRGSWASGVRGLYHHVMFEKALADRMTSRSNFGPMVEGRCMDHIYIFLLTLIFTLFPDPVRKEWEFFLMNSRVAKVLVGIFVCCPLALARHVSGHCYGFADDHFQLCRRAPSLYANFYSLRSASCDIWLP